MITRGTIRSRKSISMTDPLTQRLAHSRKQFERTVSPTMPRSDIPLVVGDALSDSDRVGLSTQIREPSIEIQPRESIGKGSH